MLGLYFLKTALQKKGSTDLWNELRDKVKSGHMSAFSAAWEWTKSAE